MRSTILEEIYRAKRAEIEQAKAERPLAELRALAADAAPPSGFIGSIERCQDIALIAEVKRASPSHGDINPGLNPAALGAAYERGGATCISVLTDRKYFKGSAEDLRACRAAINLPVLRKDFIIDEYQVYESRAMGADALLLVMGSVPDAPLKGLVQAAESLQMDVLLEAHSHEEAERALRLGARLVGINSRDLRTFQTDREASLGIISAISRRCLAVSESAVKNAIDVRRAAAAGARAVLVGTALSGSSDPEGAVRALLE